MVVGPCCGCMGDSPKDCTDDIADALNYPTHRMTTFSIEEGTHKVINPSNFNRTQDQKLKILDPLLIWLKEMVARCLSTVANVRGESGFLFGFDCLLKIFCDLGLEDVVQFEGLSKTTYLFFREAWKSKSYTLFQTINLPPSKVDSTALSLHGGNYKTLVLSSGILFKDSLTLLEQSTEHVIITFHVPGSRLPKRVLFHRNRNGIRCDCPLDLNQSWKITNFFDVPVGYLEEELIQEVFTAPYIPYPYPDNTWYIRLEKSFPQYRLFLENFQNWSRFIRLNSGANLSELLTRTDHFLDAYAKDPTRFATDDIILGIHHRLLQSSEFEKFSVKKYHGILNVDFSRLLEFRETPEQREASEEVWRNFYQNKTKLTKLGKDTCGLYKTLCSLYNLALVWKKDERPFDDILEGYGKFLDECCNSPGESIMCEDLIIDALYHLHLLHPAQFRQDCLIHFSGIIHHIPEPKPDTHFLIVQHHVDSDELRALTYDTCSQNLTLSPIPLQLRNNQMWKLFEYSRVIPAKYPLTEEGWGMYLSLFKPEMEKSRSWKEIVNFDVRLSIIKPPEDALQGWKFEENGELVPNIVDVVPQLQGFKLMMKEGEGEDGIVFKVPEKKENVVWGVWPCSLYA